MKTHPDTVIDAQADAFVVEFLNVAGYLVAVSPIYVVGVEETPNGVSIRTARGSVADQFLVRGPVRAVLDRLRRCWHVAQDSFLAAFMRSDTGVLQDRMMERLRACLDQELRVMEGTIVSKIGPVARQEIERLAASDAPAEGPTRPGSKKAINQQR